MKPILITAGIIWGGSLLLAAPYLLYIHAYWRGHEEGKQEARELFDAALNDYLSSDRFVPASDEVRAAEEQGR